jgi:tetratricopeptide (TPR) repeat protein
MTKAPKSKTSTTKKKSESGLTGGPSNMRGVTYQVDHAVLLLLDQISLNLADPFTPRFITMEPRLTTPQVTRWDIRTEPPDTTFEAKFNPKRDEVIDWLKLVRQASSGTPDRMFRLVYAEERGAARLIYTVKALSRIANEVGGDENEFRILLDHEEVKGAEEVIDLLGENAIQILQQVEVEQKSESGIESDTQLRLRYLLCPEKTRELRSHLFERLQRGAPARTVLAVRDLIDELRGQGFTFYQPQRIDSQALSPNVFAALAVLENCKTGLPAEVLSAVTGMPAEALTTELAAIDKASYEGGLWLLAPLGAPLAHPEEATLRAQALEEILSYIRAHGKSPSAQSQVPNVIALAEACLSTRPRLVAKVFGVLDKLLKEMGKKHLVRDVAWLSKTAAQRATTVDREMKLAMIRSLICGLTWYYQRVGDLEEANASAKKSYRFAQEVDSKEDLAFSAKCTGRLRRLEAENVTGNERNSKLSESLGMLSTAIEHFKVAEGYGPDHPEVGDCYSLMARTHLVAGDLPSARNKVGRAFARLRDDAGKDRIDAIILAGDIAAASGDDHDALIYYDQAVTRAQSPGRDVTEMRARALRQRGHIKRKIGNLDGARTDFNEAMRIWNELEEPNYAAEAEFEMLDLSVQLSEHPRSLLLNEPAAVRAKAMRFHIDKLDEYNLKDTKAAGRRQEPPPRYWKELIKQAHGAVGLEMI